MMPTLRSVGVYEQYRQYAAGHEVAVSVVGNKVAGPDDEAFLRERVGVDLLGCLTTSAHVRATEQGDPRPIDQLEPANAAVLAAMRAAVDATVQDWDRFHAQGVDFHRRNALAWGNARIGTDLTAQIDAGFVHPALATAAG